MGERQDWPITAPFLNRRLRRGKLGCGMLAIAWLTSLGEETEKAKWDTGQDWRTGLIFVQRLLTGEAI
jgi:hypothetical protein